MDNILEVIYKRYNQLGDLYNATTVPNQYIMIQIYKEAKRCRCSNDKEEYIHRLPAAHTGAEADYPYGIGIIPGQGKEYVFMAKSRGKIRKLSEVGLLGKLAAICRQVDVTYKAPIKCTDRIIWSL